MFKLSMPQGSIGNRERFEEALARFDAINQQDPTRIEYDGASLPTEYLLAQALFYRVLEMKPDASEPLLLASRSQHLKRWEHPRSEYPEGRVGYLKWRADQKVFHAQETAKILADLGYDSWTMDAVRELNLKRSIKGNPDCQTLEDGLCLVFLQFQYDAIAEKYPEEKTIDILRKTAAKMSAEGLEHAKKLDYSPRGLELLMKALG